jgi:hypothetical protein
MKALLENYNKYVYNFRVPNGGLRGDPEPSLQGGGLLELIPLFYFLHDKSPVVYSRKRRCCKEGGGVAKWGEA